MTFDKYLVGVRNASGKGLAQLGMQEGLELVTLADANSIKAAMREGYFEVENNGGLVFRHKTLPAFIEAEEKRDRTWLRFYSSLNGDGASFRSEQAIRDTYLDFVALVQMRKWHTVQVTGNYYEIHHSGKPENKKN